MFKKAFVCLIIILTLSLTAFAAEEAPQGSRGERPQPPEGFENMQPPEGFENMQPPEGFEMPQGGRGGRMPFGENNTAAPELNNESSGDLLSVMREYQTPIISVILLALAFPFVILYKRKKY